MLDLDTLERLAKAATQGERLVEVRHDDGGAINHVIYVNGGDLCALYEDARPRGYRRTQKADADFIAAASPAAIQELIDTLRAAQAHNASLAKALEESGKKLLHVHNRWQEAEADIALLRVDVGKRETALAQVEAERDALRADLAMAREKALLDAEDAILKLPCAPDTACCDAGRAIAAVRALASGKGRKP